MADTDPLETEERAVDDLTELGLTLYAARTFVALVGLGNGTARDVSDVVDVPRPRVYDAVEELRELGLVDVRYSSPRRFWPVSAHTAVRTLRRDFEERAADLGEVLETLQQRERPEESVGVLTVTGRSAVTERCLSFVEQADERLVFASAEPLLGDDVLAALDDAGERGVDVRVAGMSEAAEDRVADQVPAAELFESLWDWSDAPAGRLLIVDGERTLVSVLTDDFERDDGSDGETAVWGAGESNHLVVVLRAVFSWRLDGLEAP